MEIENVIIIHAPIEKVFETAADLSLWPKFLPHYRWIEYLERSPTQNVVRMAAKRNWIPVTWTSLQEIDREKMEVRFHHLKAFTRGMNVVWTFTPVHQGVQVRIRHELHRHIPVLRTVLDDWIVGKFFIHYIANQTLTHMKYFVEKTYGK